MVVFVKIVSTENGFHHRFLIFQCIILTFGKFCSSENMYKHVLMAKKMQNIATRLLKA